MLNHYSPNAEYKIMVCITPQESCRRLIEEGYNRALKKNGEFCSVYVNKSDYISSDLTQHKILQELFDYAQKLGGRVTILKGKKVFKTLAEFAKANGVNEIIVGGSMKSAFNPRSNRKKAINPLKKQIENHNIFINIVE